MADDLVLPFSGGVGAELHRRTLGWRTTAACARGDHHHEAAACARSEGFRISRFSTGGVCCTVSEELRKRKTEHKRHKSEHKKHKKTGHKPAFLVLFVL